MRAEPRYHKYSNYPPAINHQQLRLYFNIDGGLRPALIFFVRQDLGQNATYNHQDLTL
jgi:hypothetical protein